MGSPLSELLSKKRSDIMEKIQVSLINTASESGVQLIDVRIGRTDLPKETSHAVYNRMRSSRIAEAAHLRAEGAELKEKIQAEAEREKIGIHSEAKRQAQVLHGEGDAQ